MLHAQGPIPSWTFYFLGAKTGQNFLISLVQRCVVFCCLNKCQGRDIISKLNTISQLVQGGCELSRRGTLAPLHLGRLGPRDQGCASLSHFSPHSYAN